ncbi:NAD(P)-dependent oxidoreductase [Ferrovibrio sp.]|uniref:NAD-dependent epimerase/dehydratase family protein n=1 Tax=Ferrovibrio sp. TaxID=1917215 RepID=UPI0031203635
MNTESGVANIPYDTIDLTGERIMLVGGAGFIGHHLALELRRKGAEIVVLDNLQINNVVKILTDASLDPVRRQLYLNFLTSRFEMMREAGIHIETVDARMFPEFARAFNTFLPTKAVHLAAISSAVVANQVPGLAYDLQITSLRHLLDLCQLKESVCRQVQFLSSSTVYGDFEGSSVDETVRPQPKGVYANGKYMGERMMREAKRLFGLDYTIIRPSALYGIRCISGRVSQKFVENAMTGKPLLLEGGGSGMLDFTHIDDLIEGMVRSLGVSGGLSRTFNITFGNARTIAELAAIVKDVVPEVKFEERPAAAEKPKRGTLHIHRAKEYLGFVPSRPLETGYREYCQWYVNEWRRAAAMVGK